MLACPKCAQKLTAGHECKLSTTRRFFFGAIAGGLLAARAQVLKPSSSACATVGCIAGSVPFLGRPLTYEDLVEAFEILRDHELWIERTAVIVPLSLTKYQELLCRK